METLIESNPKIMFGKPVIKSEFLFARDFEITYSEKGGFFTRRKLMFTRSLEGGCHAEIEFDPFQDKFVIKEVKLWGI